MLSLSGFDPPLRKVDEVSVQFKSAERRTGANNSSDIVCSRPHLSGSHGVWSVHASHIHSGGVQPEAAAENEAD